MTTIQLGFEDLVDNRKGTLINPAQPFVKWAGGKRTLIKKINDYLPPALANGTIERYIEPFVGGGAMFFYIAQLYSVPELFIFDINQDLIMCYQTIKKEVNDLIENLERIETYYSGLSIQSRQSWFYYVRRMHNDERYSFNYKKFNQGWVNRSARFIFLNKTCYNGLYRVNSRGDFNSSFNLYEKNFQIYDKENLLKASEVLQKTHIECGDFTECRRFVTPKSFVYFDPPYKPLNKVSSFTAYSKSGFNDDSQVRLAGFFKELDKAGTKIMLSNSNCLPYFQTLYDGFNIHSIKAARMINSNGNKRGKIKELLINNY